VVVLGGEVVAVGQVAASDPAVLDADQPGVDEFADDPIFPAQPRPGPATSTAQPDGEPG
jgi:hypothetical protein